MSVIDDYLKDVDPAQKAVLEHVRSLVHEAVPDAEETISYGMPSLKYKGQSILWFGAFKHHMSIFPLPEAIQPLQGDLAGFATSKGTIQFTVEKPLPDAVIRKLIASRLKTISKP